MLDLGCVWCCCVFGRGLFSNNLERQDSAKKISHNKWESEAKKNQHTNKNEFHGTLIWMMLARQLFRR